MGVRGGLDILALLVCSGYCTIPLFWLMMHPLVERWRPLGRRAFLFILPAWAVVIAIVFLIAWPFRDAHFYVAWFAWAPAAIFFLLGFSIYSAAQGERPAGCSDKGLKGGTRRASSAVSGQRSTGR
jgi:hypothetical protein